MFHKAVKLDYKEGTVLELTFDTGEVKRYDMAAMFEVYPPLRALEDRQLFLRGKLSGNYGIIWNDALDIEAETVYEEGTLVGQVRLSGNREAAEALLKARAAAGVSQKELSVRTGIDQSDISKIERGLANPSVSTLERLAAGLDAELCISFKKKEAV